MSSFLKTVPIKILTLCFHTLFFLTPLFFLPFNYELFEYNKMVLVYGLTLTISLSWILKSMGEKKFEIAKTPLDIPIFLFLAANILSTIFSLDRHVSIFGYYSRFNGGLLSIISYILLYYAFVTNIAKEKVWGFLRTALLSGFFVSIWGILEHFGRSFSCFAIQGKFDVSCWVQDVKTRVFATLGQPNWLAAYMAILVPISLAFSLHHSQQDSKKITIQNIFYLFLTVLFYATLLFTKSRSGFIGLGIGLIIFFMLLIINFRKKSIVPLVIINCALLITTFFFNTPFDQLNKFTFDSLKPTAVNHQPTTVSQQPSSGETSLADTGITTSSKIREIVWKGAIDIYKAYPIFGSGLETFAYAYYRYRPAEHNLTSEWDFLYNKAHNEYLNYLATTGTVGIVTYIIFIGYIYIVSLKNSVFRIQNTEKNSKLLLNSDFCILSSLLSAFTTILITNFFGFSVVAIQIFFYLLPAIMILTLHDLKKRELKLSQSPLFSSLPLSLFAFLPLFLFYLLLKGWVADYTFADGYHSVRASEMVDGYDNLKKAIALNSSEPLYYDEFSYPAAAVAVALHDDQKNETLSKQLVEEAIYASDKAISISPNNVNFWKTRNRVFYTLSDLDPKYLNDSLTAIETAIALSPTDPKVRYNRALILNSLKEKDESIAEITRAISLKPDYHDAYITKALLLVQYNEKEKAREVVEEVFKKFDPNDADAKKVLEEINK